MKKESIGKIEHQEKKMTLAEAIAKRNTYKENINTRDIYPLVGAPLLARDYYGSTKEEQAIMVEEELKLYIAHKLAYCGFFILDQDALQIDISDLLTKLYERTGKDNEIVHQITHYILGLLTENQGYQVIWEIENDESYKITPVLEEKEGMLDKLKTHKETNPIIIFNFVFEYYLTKCKKEKLTRTRKREELPKTGE